jgi:tRNA G26 N,N-dimethylase Trm1
LDFCGCNYHSCGPVWAGSAQHGAIDDNVIVSYDTVRYYLMLSMLP